MLALEQHKRRCHQGSGPRGRRSGSGPGGNKRNTWDGRTSYIRIGIDLGGTNIAVGVVDDGHAIVSRVSVPTWPAARRRRWWGHGRRRGQVLGQGRASVGDCRSMGVGSPGTCNSAAGVVERPITWDGITFPDAGGCWSRSATTLPCAALAVRWPTVPLVVLVVTLGRRRRRHHHRRKIYDGMRGPGPSWATPCWSWTASLHLRPPGLLGGVFLRHGP